MATGSFAKGTLAEINAAGIEQMLTLDETLFVEHKKDIGSDTAHQVIKAISSFANSLGGWLLIGVHGSVPTGDDFRWAGEAALPLVDVVRDRLRGEIDPLPAFEAKVVEIDRRPVGVVRVYESSDTPHVAVRSGAIYVRAVAEDSDASKTQKSGSGNQAKRRYEAAAIRSQEQLNQLARRGDIARTRVAELFRAGGSAIPLIAEAVGPSFSQIAENRWQPRHADHGRIIVRAAPYTVAARFRSWATTADASAAAMAAAESLAHTKGLHQDFLNPHPSGVSISAEIPAGAIHHDATGEPLGARTSVAIDGAGVVAASLQLAHPDNVRPAGWSTEDFGRKLVAPVVREVAGLLEAGEFLGRAWFQIDIIGLSACLLLEPSAQGIAYWVPTNADIAVPALDEDVDALVLLAANACARSAGLRAWDPPLGPH